MGEPEATMVSMAAEMAATAASASPFSRWSAALSMENTVPPGNRNAFLSISCWAMISRSGWGITPWGTYTMDERMMMAAWGEARYSPAATSERYSIPRDVSPCIPSAPSMVFPIPGRMRERRK